MGHERTASADQPATVVEPDRPDAEVFVFPASLEQSRYWILDQLDADSTASNMAIAFCLEGRAEDALVEQSIRELVLRHEALRTNFRMVDGELSQVISEEPRFSFSISGLSGLPPAEAQARAEALILEHGRARIDLANGPVFFVHLIHLSERDHFLAFTIHHIACDGWSNGILVRDFAAIYAALSENRPPSLPPLPFQFADFTVWQQEWLTSHEATSALAFWREHIRQDMPAVDLPTDHPRSAKKSAPGHIESQLLPPALQAKLKAYCREHAATMHQALLAAFEGLISRYTDQENFLLGSTIANRTQPGMEHVVGRFANPQVILADVHGDPSYRELVERVAEWSAKSYAHQDLPFSRLIEEFQLDQSGGTSQFLQIYFVYQKAFMQPQEAGGLKVIPRPSVSGGVNFDLLVSVVERAEGPRLQIEYNTLLFDKRRIRRLIEMYTRVLEAVMDADSLKVSQLPLLSQEEKASLEIAGLGPQRTGLWSTEDHSGKAGAHSVPAWLDRWAETEGESTAIVAGNERVSWRLLRTRSLTLAHGLKRLGVKPGQTVALRMERAADTAAMALAVLRLGAVVLPIPQATIAAEWNLLLLDFQPALSLARQSFAEKFSIVTSFEWLSKEATKAAALSLDPLPYPPAANAAWLNLRTERNGRYQATAVSHQATLDAMLGAGRRLDTRPGDSAAIWTAESSAESWIDLMLPLLSGAAVVYADDLSAQQLPALLDREQAAFAVATPAEFLDLLAAGWKSDRRLHLVCRGIGTATSNLKRRASYPGKVDVLYTSPFTAGPFAVAPILASNEIGTNVSSGPDTRQPGSQDAGSRGIVDEVNCPLSPLAGQQWMVLDRFDNLTPFGVPGALAIRTDQNAAAIRTGYQARYSPERGFELEGLTDRTVRLPGYRLRLGDLETVLYQSPEIATAEAALLTRDGAAAAPAAYITGRKGQRPSAQRASSLLKERVPGYLSAAEIIVVDSIPRRADGSPNFSLLPRPDAPRTAASETAAHIPPRDELEATLVGIWEEAFGVRGIGIRDSFFSLGGYSLTIVRLFARINKTFGTLLPITTVFNAPTIEQLADILRGRATYSSLVPVQPRGSKPPFFLILSYLVYGGLRSALGEDRPFYGLRELESEGEMTLEARASIYVREIRAVAPHGPYYIGGWCAAGSLAVETARQLTETGESVAILVLFDSWRPGYAAELSAQQKGNPEMTAKAILRRKVRFHRMQLEQLSAAQRVKYFWVAGVMKVKSLRDKFYLRHWSLAQRMFTTFGAPLPHFMHNISRNTLDSVKEYKGKPFPGRMTLIRAAEAPYLPQADPSCGWNQLALQGVDVLFAPGTHESMFLEPNLTALGEILNNCFERAAKANAEPDLPLLSLPAQTAPQD